MNYSDELTIWAQNILFVMGVLLFFIGMYFVTSPRKIFKIASSLNKWIHTDNFFHVINKPIYRERYLYRYHRYVGAVIMIISLLCLYALVFYMGIDVIVNYIINLAGSEFERWLFVISYYLLIGAIFLSIIFGLIMFIRPSILKSFEKWCNQWIDTDSSLKKMDAIRELPEGILFGNPRLLGVFIILGAIYIMWITFPY